MKDKTFATGNEFFPNSFIDVGLSGTTMEVAHRSGRWDGRDEGVFGGFSLELGDEKSRKAARKALLFALQKIEVIEDENQ